jgi:hypothetical protein
MRKRYMILAAASLILFSGASTALEAYVVTSGPTKVSDMIYTWGSPDTTPYYQDAQAYDDVGLMVCSESGAAPLDKYVGLEYMMNSEVDRKNQLVSYGDENLALADQSTSFNGMDCKRTSYGSFFVSPSVISGTPEVKIAAFPSDAKVLVSDSVDGNTPKFLDPGSGMNGSYSGSITYSYSTNTLNLDLNGINVDSDQGLKSFNPGTSGRGISPDRPMLIGACRDASGQNCPAGAEKITSPSSSKTDFGFDVPQGQVNDSVTYTRYAVANGKRFGTVNIGANLDVAFTSVSTDPIYYSENQTVSFDVRNTGNVPVTSDFDVEAEIERNGDIVDSRTYQVSQNIDPGDSHSINYDWEALAHSGNYDVNIRADTTDSVTEQTEHDNTGRAAFTLRPVTFPEVMVNGETVPQEEIEFPDAGVPYNLTLMMENSDNDTLANSLIRIVERDATNSLIPTQRLDEGTVTQSKSEVTFRTDENGTASITIVPRGNVLLSDKYSDLSVQDEINYHLRMRGQQADGTDFKFIRAGNLQDYYRLEVDDPGTMRGEGTSDLPNLDSYTKIAMNGIYNIFAEFWGAVT